MHIARMDKSNTILEEARKRAESRSAIMSSLSKAFSKKTNPVPNHPVAKVSLATNNSNKVVKNDQHVSNTSSSSNSSSKRASTAEDRGESKKVKIDQSTTSSSSSSKPSSNSASKTNPSSSYTSHTDATLLTMLTFLSDSKNRPNNNRTNINHSNLRLVDYLKEQLPHKALILENNTINKPKKVLKDPEQLSNRQIKKKLQPSPNQASYTTTHSLYSLHLIWQEYIHKLLKHYTTNDNLYSIQVQSKLCNNNNNVELIGAYVQLVQVMDNKKWQILQVNKANNNKIEGYITQTSLHTYTFTYYSYSGSCHPPPIASSSSASSTASATAAAPATERSGGGSWQSVKLSKKDCQLLVYLPTYPEIISMRTLLQKELTQQDKTKATSMPSPPPPLGDRAMIIYGHHLRKKNNGY